MLAVLRRLPVGLHALRGALDLYPRPHYAYGVQQAAVLGRRLGISRISVVEFGVAGGAGLVELDRMARLATADTGVAIDVFGFDTGRGPPKPTDHRDLPDTWREGDFVMDQEALRLRLPQAELVLGDIHATVPGFLEAHDPVPIGFVSIDVDYYSSTAAALRIFRGDDAHFLPRVFCCLDDTAGDDDQVVHGGGHDEAAAVRRAVASPPPMHHQDRDAIFAALETVNPDQLRRNIGDLQNRWVHLAKQRGPVRVDPIDQRAVICARPFADRVRSPGALDG